MEATKESVQEQQETTQTKNLGNNVPNTLNKTQSNFAQNANSILQSSTQYKSKEDPVNRFAKSMNLPKDVSIVKMPKNVEKTKYQIPPSEYIGDAPYLKKTQIFPSYVRNNIYLINILFIFR